jgi:hypothetical protein
MAARTPSDILPGGGAGALMASVDSSVLTPPSTVDIIYIYMYVCMWCRCAHGKHGFITHIYVYVYIYIYAHGIHTHIRMFICTYAYT